MQVERLADERRLHRESRAAVFVAMCGKRVWQQRMQGPSRWRCGTARMWAEGITLDSESGYPASRWRSSRTIALAAVVAGLATPAVILVAKSWITTRTHREQRISRVVDAYMGIRSIGGFSGIRALLAAGVKRLESHEEIREALRRIAERTGCDTFVGYDAAVLKYRK